MESTLTKITVARQILQDLVARAVKGSSMQPLIPLSCLMQVKVQDNKLYVRTTDNSNYLTVFGNITAPNFEAVIDSKQFASIISKITTDNISLSIEDKKLIIEGNGKYIMSIASDADGSAITFPEVSVETTSSAFNITSFELKSIATLSKSCKADNREVPCLFNYYADSNGVTTTNQFKASFNPIKITENPISIPANVIDLALSAIPSINSDKGAIDIYQDDTRIVFESVDAMLVAPKATQADVEKFPAENLAEVFKSQAANTITISRTELLQAIDRIAVFTEAYEGDRFNVMFKAEGVLLKSQLSDSQEMVKYSGSHIISQDSELMNIDSKYLKQILASCSEDVKISFGSVDGMQFECENIKILLGQVD